MTVDKEMISSIGKGVLAFAAVAPGDTEKEADLMAAKVLRMKLWDDEEGGKVRSGWVDMLHIHKVWDLTGCSTHSGRKA